MSDLADSAAVPGPVHVRVPATSANLGPGFDALGLALDLFEEVVLAPLPEPAGEHRIRVSGVSAGRLHETTDLLAFRAAAAVYEQIGRPMPRVALELVTRIPSSRGLGSSAAAIVGGAVAANTLAGEPLDKQALLELVTRLEGHPDNVAAALLGGLVIGVQGRRGLVVKRLDPPTEIVAVLCIPERAMSTKSARGVVPERVSREDAVFNLGRTALLIAAFQTRDWARLRDAMDDRIHQPPRGRVFPALFPAIEAALAAGAHGAALSGAGSTIIALASDRQDEIGAAMLQAVAAHGFPARTEVLGLSAQGATAVAAPLPGC
jgi:homoserine kinase